MSGKLRARSLTSVPDRSGHDLIAGPAGFPEDFQRSAVRRLGYLSLIYGGAYLIAYSVGFIVSTDLMPMRQRFSILDVVAIISIAVAFAMYGLVRLSMAGRLDSALRRWRPAQLDRNYRRHRNSRGRRVYGLQRGGRQQPVYLHPQQELCIAGINPGQFQSG